jgi:hypothetical protein
MADQPPTGENPFKPTSWVMAELTRDAEPGDAEQFRAIWDEITRLNQKNARVVLCPPELVDRVQALLDGQGVAGLFTVTPTPDLAPGRIVVTDRGAGDTPGPAHRSEIRED